MADIQLFDLEFHAEQTTGARFPVTVAVENNETVAPLIGSPALCSAGVLSPDGHTVEVTFTVRNAAGEVVKEKTEQECATVEQPSNVAGETRARITLALDEPGEYTIEAEAHVPHAGGHASAQPKSLSVERDPSGVPGGDEEADRGTDWGLPQLPSLGDQTSVILVLLVVIAILGAIGGS